MFLKLALVLVTSLLSPTGAFVTPAVRASSSLQHHVALKVGLSFVSFRPDDVYVFYANLTHVIVVSPHCGLVFVNVFVRSC